MTPAEKIEATAKELGLSLDSEFVPFSQSRNKAKKHPSLNWRITLKRNDVAVLETDYSAGCGHCPSYQKATPANWDRPDRDWQPTVLRWECENGYAAVFGGHYAGFRRSNIPDKRGRLAPRFADVIYSLVLDSNVLDYARFEDWAGEYGYDSDSRKAEIVYRACLEIALSLRNTIGESGMDELREACLDY